MNKEFQVHVLNEVGKEKASVIAELFDNLLNGLRHVCGEVNNNTHELFLVRTKLEEASFFAKKAMALNPENVNEGESFVAKEATATVFVRT